MNINGQRYEFTFKVASQIDKELGTKDVKGFDALINGLLERDVSVLVKAIRIVISQSGIATEDSVVEMLNETFQSEEQTDELFDAFFTGLTESGFLKQKLVTKTKGMEENYQTLDNLLPTIEEPVEKIAAEAEMNKNQLKITRLKEIIAKA